ncbi:MAG: RNA polymerase sigma factor [Acidobacteriota bacterium]
MKSSERAERDAWIQTALEDYQASLIRYARRITGDMERAREVVQDTFLRLCRQKRSRIQGHLAEWLFTVCRNRALDVRRKESRMTVLSEARAESRPDPKTGPFERLEIKERSRRVLELLASFSDNQQEVVRLKFQQGLSYREISRVTQLSVSNIGFLLHTALKKIRRQIEAEAEITLPSIRRIK